MIRYACCVLWLVVVAFLVAPLAHADLYSAQAAYQKKDFAKAFEQFRELAELGYPLAQESLAVMYVKGEGVARDNVRGYAWAIIATENGMGANVQPIIAQLESRLTPAARKTADEVRGRFGKAALEQTLLPLQRTAETAAEKSSIPICKMTHPVNPDNYYPAEAVSQGVAGSVQIRTLVLADGRARNPRVVLSVPPNAFDAAGRQVALETGYQIPEGDGESAQCTINFVIRFTTKPEKNVETLSKEIDRLKRESDTGDPMAQLQYGVLMTAFYERNKERENFAPLFLKSAQAGVRSAQYLIGLATLSGNGVVRDRKKGIAWLNIAAEGGQHDAQIALANELLHGSPNTEDATRARSLLEQAVATGSEEARYYLADVLIGDADPARREPQRALEMLGEVFELKSDDPATFEIRAAAMSQLGNFDGALRAQKTAMAKARKLKWDAAPLAARLAMYEKKQAWTQRLLVY